MAAQSLLVTCLREKSTRFNVEHMKMCRIRIKNLTNKYNIYMKNKISNTRKAIHFLYALLALALLVGCNKKNVFIGDVYEDSHMINIMITVPVELIEVNDTLFFMVKNDTMYTCGNKYGNLYMRRHKY